MHAKKQMSHAANINPDSPAMDGHHLVWQIV